MTPEDRRWLRESEQFLEEMQERGRVRARQRLKSAPETLSEYDRQLLGPEVPVPQVTSSAEPREAASRRKCVADVLTPRGIVFRNLHNEQLNAHAITLALEHHIAVVRCHYDEARAEQEARRAHVPAVTNDQTYAVFLHEVGHVVSPEADSRQYRHAVEKIDDSARQALLSPLGEIGAWRFAVTHALTWSAEMQAEMYRCLSSYVPTATDDERWAMRCFVTEAALKIKDKPWTFGELAENCDRLYRQKAI